MKSDKMRMIDEAAVARPWKWFDATLLWNEEADHCVLSHGGTNWPVAAGNRVAIESAMNHMPALIELVAACERRQHAVAARREFGVRAYREDPYSILSDEFKEQASKLDAVISVAERELVAALDAVHIVGSPSGAEPSEKTCAPAVVSPLSHGCPVHQGSMHGGEAEELRSGIEALVAQGDVRIADLQELLERVDSRDSLGHLERIDLATGIASILADEDLTSGAVHAELRRLLDGVAGAA